MIKLLKVFKGESGQSMVFVTLAMVAILGCAALAVDIGRVVVVKSQLQNAADAAALAAVKELPKSTAINTAKSYAKENGVNESSVTVNVPYNGDFGKIEVICSKKLNFTFARILGFDSTKVSARSVATTDNWLGDALPFINLDGNAEESAKGEILQGWNMVGPGDKERIDNSDLVITNDRIKVKYEDGLILYTKGKDMSQIKTPLNNILSEGKIVYLFSLKKEKIESYKKKGENELKNGDKIPLSDLVLLKCQVVKWDGKIVALKYLEAYEVPTSGDIKFPDGSEFKQTIKLIE